MIELATQSSEKMIESSNMRAPPIRRRLSALIRKRYQMPENCLLKIKPTISPPPTTLSKAVAEDMKLKLLTRMKDLLNQGLKFQTLRAWGWFNYPFSQDLKP
ncbi:TELOMERE-ASSOCIATED PROTEIN RIF1 [Salix viminalis]|uniref:TELOMERE-ASSOCIATED PROTEIN RIF1 n=1 Tax=Salix viminalis TaxID=40686 RepID=A0A9Q0V582_SALVM|nr:TELOMERE-ASSOCIATED PROTEIN RIF1 [Salix viminalis]